MIHKIKPSMQINTHLPISIVCICVGTIVNSSLVLLNTLYVETAHLTYNLFTFHPLHYFHNSNCLGFTFSILIINIVMTPIWRHCDTDSEIFVREHLCIKLQDRFKLFWNLVFKFCFDYERGKQQTLWAFGSSSSVGWTLFITYIYSGFIFAGSSVLPSILFNSNLIAVGER